jgi:hypothetical protein
MSFVKIIRRPAAQFESGLVLDDDQIGFETDTKKIKIGDNVTTWANLLYVDPLGLGQTGAAILASLGLGSTSTEIDRFNDVSAYQEAIILAGALTLTKKYHSLAIPTGGAITLAAPPATMLGQFKMIEMITDDGDVTLSLANVVGGSAATTCTFDTAGDKLILQAAFDKWVVVKEFGVTMS